MRFMMMHRLDDSSPEAWAPSKELMAEMGKLMEEMSKEGVLLSGEGLRPSAVGPGARITYSGGKRTVVDGPFAEAKEVIAGFALINVPSRQEAIEWADRFAQLVGDVEVEVRRVAEAEDFGAEFTPELREQEERLRAEGEKRQKPPLSSNGVAQYIFVNLPVHDLDRSVAFFTKLGYTFNPQFTGENAACMIVSETIFVMLLVEDYFKTFTPKPIADAKRSTEALVALSAVSREAVDQIVKTALAAGAREYREPQDHGFMYQWGFEDPDGHIWEYAWMDPAFVQQ